jgi:transcriptional regulator with XRE-family HTH domain
MAKTMDPAYFVAWRKRIGLTQAQFAAKSGDHLVTVKRWETGARKLPPHIGWIMAAIEHGLQPIGKEAMIEYEVPRMGGTPLEPKPEAGRPPEHVDWLYKDAWKEEQASPVEPAQSVEAKAEAEKIKEPSESKS